MRTYLRKEKGRAKEEDSIWTSYLYNVNHPLTIWSFSQLQKMQKNGTAMELKPLV